MFCHFGKLQDWQKQYPAYYNIKESLILISSGIKPEVLNKVDLSKLCAAFILTHKGSGILPQSL